MIIEKYKLQIHGDDRGNLIAIEELKDVPFSIRRIYYMYGTGEGVERGFHAHKNLTQLLICVSGSCAVILDDGTEREEVLLNDPSEGLLITNNIWREMKDFSSDAVLLVLASELYNEADYIRDYKDFLDYIK